MAVPITAMIPFVESYEIASEEYRLLKLVLELGVPIPKTVFVHDGNAKDAVNRVTLLKANQRWMKTSVHIVKTRRS